MSLEAIKKIEMSIDIQHTLCRNESAVIKKIFRFGLLF